MRLPIFPDDANEYSFLRENRIVTPQETNWFNLFGKYTPEKTTWHALTTVYSLELEVIRAYKFMRAFSTNTDQSIVYHQNTSYLPDNQINEQSWELEKPKCNLPDGVFHPASESMRAIGFGNETSIWVCKELIPNDNFGSEVFFQHQDWRHSVIPVYQEGNLARIVVIKENKLDFPHQFEEDKISYLSGKWQLEQVKMTPDLQISKANFPPQEINLPSTEDNQSYFLPEKTLLNLPKSITPGQAFEILAGKQIANNLYKQVKTQYDSTGKLMGLISEAYNLDA